MSVRPVTLVALVLVACASAPPRPQTPAAPPPVQATIASDRVDGDVREVMLSNGLRVLLKENHAAPVATLGVYYRVGSRNEHVGITGSSHLLEHLAFKGTEKFQGKGAMWEALGRIGASFNATTSYDRTNYYETVPIEHLPFAIRLEADRMRRATFTDADRASEMTVVRNELERGENEPSGVLNDQVWATAFAAHPYHHPVIGWRSDVENVPTSQLRRYYDAYYQPDNAVLALVGDFQSDEALKLIVEEFGQHAGGHEFAKVYTVEEPQQGERRITVQRPGEIGIVQLGWKLPGVASPDTVPLKILQLVLAGSLDVNEFGDPISPGISHRLYQALVEKQLSTGAGMDYTLMIDPSVASISARIRPGVAHRAVEDAIRGEITKLRNEPITPAELTRAKQRARAAFGLSQDGTFGQAMALGYFGLIGDWRFVREFARRIDQVTAEDVTRVARTWFPDEGVTVGWFVPTKAEAPPTRPQPKAALDAKPRHFRTLRPADDRAEAAAVTARALAEDGSGGDDAATRLRKKTLSNGLRVVVLENPATVSFALMGSMRAGSVHEKTGEAGLSGVTAAMLERGTTRHGKLELAARLEDLGASFNLGGGFEGASVFAMGLGEDLDAVLEVLAEELLAPAFPADELEKLKAERVARLQQSEDSTRVKGQRALYQKLYPKNHPFYVPDVGEAIADTKSYTPERVRGWYERYWGPDRMVISIVGRVKADEVFARLEQRLGAWKPVGGPKVESPAVPMPEAPSRIDVLVPGKANVDVLLGHPGDVARTSPDYYAAMLANQIVGGAVTSRLFRKVRNELGLTYGINSGLSAGQVSGPWTISLTVNPKAVDQALEAVRGVLATWHDKGVTDEELKDVKTALTGQYKVGLATNAGLAGVFTQYEILGLGAEFVAEHPKRISAVTKEEVDAAIRLHYAPARLITVVSGTLATP